MKKTLSLLLAMVMVFSLVGCGKKETEEKGPEYRNDVKVSTIVDEVKKAYGEDYAPNMQYSEEEIATIFGVNSDLYDEAIAEGPKVSFSVDNFVAIKAKEGKAEEVKKALDAYRENLVNDVRQYPMNQLKIQASRVDVFGDYVFFTMLGAIPMDVEEKGDDAVIEKAKELNQVAIDVIEKQLKNDNTK